MENKKTYESFLDNVKVRKLVNGCPTIIDAENEQHVLIFRRILEVSLSQARWNGATFEIS